MRTLFWAIVLAGVFILGIGYGRTLSGEDELRSDEVTVTVPRGSVTATLPTETITVTRTVARSGGAAGGRRPATTDADRP